MQDLVVKNAVKANSIGTMSLMLPSRMTKKLNITHETQLTIKLECNSLIISKFVG